MDDDVETAHNCVDVEREGLGTIRAGLNPPTDLIGFLEHRVSRRNLKSESAIANFAEMRNVGVINRVRTHGIAVTKNPVRLPGIDRRAGMAPEKRPHRIYLAAECAHDALSSRLLVESLLPRCRYERARNSEDECQ